MGMLMVNPKVMCNNHLQTEHNYLHTLIDLIKDHANIQKLIKDGKVELHNITKRHEELTTEMTIRGIPHSSPLRVEFQVCEGYVNRKDSLKNLLGCCPCCQERFVNFYNEQVRIFREESLPELRLSEVLEL